MSIKQDWWKDIEQNLTSSQLAEANLNVGAGLQVSPFACEEDLEQPTPVKLSTAPYLMIGAVLSSNYSPDFAIVEEAISLGTEVIYWRDTEELNPSAFDLRGPLKRILVSHSAYEQFAKSPSIKDERIAIGFQSEEELSIVNQPSIADASLFVTESDDPIVEVSSAGAMLKRAFELGVFSHLEIVLNLNDQFAVNLCKIRALRLLVNQLLSQAMSPSDVSLSVILPSLPPNHSSRIRNTAMATAAASAGVSCIYTPMTSGYDITMLQILKEETGIVGSLDPSAGSYYFERLTNMIASEAWQLLQSKEQ